MPLIVDSTYKAPLWLPGGHAQTMFPVLFRKITPLPYHRVTLDTPDEDCINIDMAYAGEASSSRGVIIISHGLEGNSGRKYVFGLGRVFMSAGWDVAARNFRCCGGGMNLQPGMYHSGQTLDVEVLVNYCLTLGYKKIILFGVSMGGNQTLKYLGEKGESVPDEVVGAAVFSVPCDLVGCARSLDLPSNKIYMIYFLKTLRQKIREKHKNYPELYPLEGLENIRTFNEFDNRYTAPVHGFSSALDYWERASSLPYLPAVKVRTLLVNAKNDPFLSKTSFPVDIARQSEFIHLEMPEQGGHVGFTPRGDKEVYWSERRVLEFFEAVL